MNRPTCYRCLCRMIPEPMWDLPRKIREFFCIHCGERYWIQVEVERELETVPN